jgi:hypothetical protein
MSDGALSFLSNPVFWTLAIAGLLFSMVRYFEWKGSLGVAGTNPISVGVGFAAFVATALGVFVSYMVIQKQFELSGPNIAGAFIATVFANLGSFLLLKDKSDFGWLDFLSFLKDGFLWSSTYPALLAAFHQGKFPVTG